MNKCVIICALCLLYVSVVISEPLPKICPNIISRKDWGARVATYVEYTPFPLNYAIIQHTATDSCNDRNECSNILKSIQNYHMDNVDYGDIGYNFMIGGDGNVYEGRGWHKQGAHLVGYNSKSVGIAFIGTFTNVSPTHEQLQAGKHLLACGVKLGELSKNYKLHGAKQLQATESPGTRLLDKMKNWPHFAEVEN